MPYKSRAQEKYFNANRGKLEAQGVNVDEWNASSKGRHLPSRVVGYGGNPALAEKAARENERDRGGSPAIAEMRELQMNSPGLDLMDPRFDPENTYWARRDRRMGTKPPPARVVGHGGDPVTGAGGTSAQDVDLELLRRYLTKRLPFRSEISPPSQHEEPEMQQHQDDGGELVGFDAQPYGNTSSSSSSGGYGYGNSTGGYGQPDRAYNLGGGVRPWLQSYTGRRTAPMSPWENYALNGFTNELNPNGAAGPSSGNFYSAPTRGYRPSQNGWLDQVQGGAQGVKNQQDADAHQQIASSMAAGGLALSGGRAAADTRYQNQSDAQFNEMLGRLHDQDWQLGEQLGQRSNENLNQGDIATNALNAQQYNQGANRRLGGWNQLFQMGGTPRGIEQNAYNGNYQDWTRQINGYEQAMHYPDTMGQSLLRGGGYGGQYQPQYGQSQASQWAGVLSGLFGGGNNGSRSGGSSGGSSGGGGSLFDRLFGGGGNQEQQGEGSPYASDNPNWGGWSNYQDNNPYDGNFGNMNMNFPPGYDYGGYYGDGSEGGGDFGGWDPSGDYGGYYGDGSEGE